MSKLSYPTDIELKSRSFLNNPQYLEILLGILHGSLACLPAAMSLVQCCGAGGAVIKSSAGAGAVIKNTAPPAPAPQHFAIEIALCWSISTKND